MPRPEILEASNPRAAEKRTIEPIVPSPKPPRYIIEESLSGSARAGRTPRKCNCQQGHEQFLPETPCACAYELSLLSGPLPCREHGHGRVIHRHACAHVYAHDIEALF